MMLVSIAAVGCHKGAPTAPTTQQKVDLNQYGVFKGESYAAGQMTFWDYGRLGWLFSSHDADNNPVSGIADLSGTNIRSRVYDGSVFKTWIIGFANSTPIDCCDSSITRDVPVPNQKVDIVQFLERRGCVAQGCWVNFEFPNQVHYQLLPDSQFRVEKETQTIAQFPTTIAHIRGNLPQLTRSTTNLSNALGMVQPEAPANESTAVLADEGYRDASGRDVVTKWYVPPGAQVPDRRR
jgi:hypothetical protein